MTASYDEALPTDKDRARMRLGDTMVDPESSALLSDEHITAVLADRGGLEAGVGALADELIARFANEPVQARSSDGAMVDYSARLGVWTAIAAAARSAAGGGAISFVPATYGAGEAADEFARPFRWC